MSLSERIKALAAAKGETFASLERTVGFGQGTIRRWDTNVPSADRLLEIANLLDTSMDYLMTGQYPTSQDISTDERDLLDVYRSLSERKQGQVRGYLERMIEEPVAAGGPDVPEEIAAK